MDTLINVSLSKLNELHTNGGMMLLYHFLKNEPSHYMFEDFQSILIFNEVKAGNEKEQHDKILAMLGVNGI